MKKDSIVDKAGGEERFSVDGPIIGVDRRIIDGAVERLMMNPDSLVELRVQLTVTVLDEVGVAIALVGAAGEPVGVGSNP